MPTTHRYVPANTKADLPKGSPYRAMDAFLLSDRVQDAADAAAKDIAAEAAARAGKDSGELASRYDAVDGGVQSYAGNPRRTSAVVNDSPHAAADEFGNSRRAGSHTLREVGARYDTAKGVA